LTSRRHFLAELNREMRDARLRGSPLALAIFDVDHFKQINDRLGHGAGDQVLRAIAGIASRAVRAGDLVGRLGGEEFGVIMPGAFTEAARLAGERLRTEVAAAVLPHVGRPVTVSIGIAVLKDGSDVEALLNAADKALYQAKRAGRNHLTMAA
jgi:diguanylate cyclase (GGDEF)-like protein